MLGLGLREYGMNVNGRNYDYRNNADLYMKKMQVNQALKFSNHTVDEFINLYGESAMLDHTVEEIVQMLDMGDFVTLLKQGALTAKEIDVYKKYLEEDNIGMEDFHNYLYGKSTDLETDERVQNALVKAIRALNPDCSESDINAKLYRFIIY